MPLTELEHEALKYIRKWPSVLPMVPPHLAAVLPELRARDMVWIKSGCWTITSHGEMTLMAATLIAQA